jgi:dipeptidyl-peptidase-4
MKRIILLTIGLSMVTSIMAQEKKLFTLDDLLPGGRTYYQHSVPEQVFYTWWGDQLVKQEVDAVKTVDGEVLFTLNDINRILSAAGERQINYLLTVEFPYPDQTIAAVSEGDQYMMVDWTTKSVVASLKFEKGTENKDFAANSRCMAYTKEHNLKVVKADGKVIAVSNDGSLDLVYGESVHRNEFGINQGTFWSPSGQLLAFYKMDQSMVTTYPQVDIYARTAQMIPDKYPMAGETSHKVYVGIFNLTTEKTIYLHTGDPTDRYFTNISWSPDDKYLYMIELNRDQNHAQLVRYDAETGEKDAVLFDETNDKYVEPMHPIQFLPWDSNKFIYQTRKDGYLHIYLYDTTGRELKQLTKGEFEVINVLGFNTKDKTVIYTSNECNPLQQNSYAVDMKGKRTLLDEGSGWHTPQLSKSGGMLLDIWSSPEVCKKEDLITIGKKTSIRNLLTAAEPWDAYQVPEMKVGTIKAADGVTDLYYRLVLPINFDPTKKYPAVVYVYGGPHAHNVDASRHWGVRGWDIWMAQKGYVMFSLDNRGSEHRGLAFEQTTFRQLGVEEMKDQIKGVEFLKSLPYVDANRLGVHGWSFGGFMTTSLMTTYPDVFKVGVAGGPVIDWKYYEVMYGERYMDTPQTNPEGYKQTSLLNKAQNLKGKLLVIYGGNDPVCVPQHTLSFLRACIDADTYPDLFTYPGDEHNMMGTDRIHLHNKITQYFEDYLK